MANLIHQAKSVKDALDRVIAFAGHTAWRRLRDLSIYVTVLCAPTTLTLPARVLKLDNDSLRLPLMTTLLTPLLFPLPVRDDKAGQDKREGVGEGQG